VPVAKALHTRYREKKIVIAGDEDKHLELTRGIKISGNEVPESTTGRTAQL
jgi:hypothetical protein